MEKSQKVLNRVQEHYDYLVAAGYNVMCTILQGSQNYGLDEYSQEYQSDVDTKSIILPTLDDIVNAAAPISTVEILPNNEHAEVKDIRVMFDMFKKMNISYIELLYSDYVVVNPEWEEYVSRLFRLKDTISALNRNQFLRCIAGMAYEKQKALCHPYPGVIDKIEGYGYDGKQLSHTVRLWEFLCRYTSGEPLSACYKTNMRDELMNYKKQLDINGELLSKEAAVELEDNYVMAIKMIKDKNLTEYDEVDIEGIAKLDKLKHDIVKECIVREVELNESK